MRLRQIQIANFQQFKDVRLDLTYPVGHSRQGEPLSRVCLIGTNGTGKSTLLEKLYWYLIDHRNFAGRLGDGDLFSFGLQQDGERYFTLHTAGYNFVFQGRIDERKGWFEAYRQDPSGRTHELLDEYRIHDDEIKASLTLSEDRNDLLVYCPAESSQNKLLGITDVPNTNLSRALKQFKQKSAVHVVSTDRAAQFWEQLIYLEKKREDDYRNFEGREENQSRRVRDVREDFDRSHPRILESLAEHWDALLKPAGLEFDFHAAESPIQLDDNLKAYVRLKGSGARVPYNRLSTGIRNFIFRLGHIHALHFGRDLASSFLLVDEPENSLYPDFLYELVDIYQRTAPGAQLFMATHSPIVAAQFDPAERFILRFDETDEHCAVTVRRGNTPEGDDPNDILKRDFEVRSLYGAEGIKAWERYLEVKERLHRETDPAEKKELASEYLQLGQAYNFPAS